MDKRKTSLPQEKLASMVTCIFAALIVTTCFLIFLFCYESAYDTGGYYISGRRMVFYYHLLIIIASILTACVLFAIFKKKLSLRVLLLIAALLPLLCYLVNYHTLKKDGLLYSLVDDGGIFHFIVIGDYDFDGMNDEEHHRLYEERVVSACCSDTFFREEIHWVDMDTTGIGAGLTGYFCKLDGEERLLTLHLRKTGVEVKKIELEITLADPALAQSFSLYLQTDSGEIPVGYTVNENGHISVVFDADTCSEWLKNAKNEFPVMTFRYEFN